MPGFPLTPLHSTLLEKIVTKVSSSPIFDFNNRISAEKEELLPYPADMPWYGGTDTK